MAFTYAFGPGIALDPVSRTTAVSATGYASLAADDTTPLTVQIGGVPTTLIETGSDGFVQQFVAEQGSVWLHFAGLTPYRVNSFDGVLATTEAAKDAAEISAQAAIDAAEIAQQAVNTGGGGGTGGGFINGILDAGEPYPSPGIYLIRPAGTSVVASIVGGFAEKGFSGVGGNLPGAIQNGDLGLAALLYNPLGTSAITPAGWTAVAEGAFSADCHLLLFRRALTSADSNQPVDSGVTTGSQKMILTCGVIRGVTYDSHAFLDGSDANPTVAVTERSVAVSFWSERTSSPATSIVPPAGYTLLNAAFHTGGGSGAGAVAYDLSESVVEVGGGTWDPDLSNQATITCTVACTVRP